MLKQNIYLMNEQYKKMYSLIQHEQVYMDKVYDDFLLLFDDYDLEFQ